MRNRVSLLVLLPIAILAVGGLVEDAAAQDATGPHVERVSFSSHPQHGDTYSLSNTIEVQVSFDEKIRVPGFPSLQLTVGTQTRVMTFRRCPGCGRGQSLFFVYTVQADDYDSNGVGIAADALSLNGATVTDLAGNGADSDLGPHAFLNDPAHKVDGGMDPVPIVRAVQISSRPGAGERYVEGETINLHVRFNEYVVVAGHPRLALDDRERYEVRRFPYVYWIFRPLPIRGAG